MSDFDLASLLDRAASLGADLDPRGSTCWWVLVDGEQVGWIRRTGADIYHATVMWTGGTRKPKNVQALTADFDLDSFDDAVEWVVTNRGQSVHVKPTPPKYPRGRRD